jgi:hypothetical protein
MAGCGLLSTDPRTDVDERADHFRRLGLVCERPEPRSVEDKRRECRGSVSGVELFTNIDLDPRTGAPLISATVSQAVGRQAALEAWSLIVLPMPGLETVRADVTAGLADWAAGGAASLTVHRGVAFVGTGEAGEWTLYIDPDNGP